MSNPVDTANASGGTTAGSTTGGTTAATGTGSTTGGTVPSPSVIVIHHQTFTSDNSWPADLVLDRRKSNWHEWDRRLNIIVDQRGFAEYLDGTLLCPDETIYPQSALNWKRSNRALRGFILEHVSERDYEIVSPITNAHNLYETLRTTHQNQGIHAQIRVMKDALDTRFIPSTPLSQTLDKIKRLHKRFTGMGIMDDDKLLIIYIMNALGDHYRPLQSTINGMLENAMLTSQDVENQVLREEELISYRERDGNTPSENTALAAVTKRERPICANCKRPGHRTEYCIAAGGQMAGKTIEEARAAQEAARAAQRSGSSGKPRNPRANTSSQANTADSGSTSVVINGKRYVLDNAVSTSAENNTNSALAALTMEEYDQHEYIAVLATTDNPLVSVNWRSHSRTPDYPSHIPVAYSAGRSPIAHPDELPFILDTGATCHISPEASDFKVLKSIPRHPVKGLCGSAIYATGMGDIELHIANGHKLKLSNVLYIPESRVRLVSILALNKTGDYTTHFDSNGCWVTNKSNTVLVRGSLSGSKRLYVLSTKIPSVQHPKTSTSSTSALSAIVPDLETWHRRLGHCNIRSIIDMAKNEVSEGMQIDLSSRPAKCDHCAIGKQSRTPVPKTREGTKAKERLGRVYVDLCGPMAVTSRTGNLYCMDLIDDFSGYVWMIPLRSKADACDALKIWHKAVTTQSGNKLRILVSDNGELVSNSMRDWCNTEGIEHLTTAPYTSAHNGRAERLHKTIVNKGRTMRLSCNAPAFLWDEFFATAAYLTNLTAASANGGRTPYHLWFDRKPSLSHLREIGCRAFCLQQPSASKIYARSSPYVLIGYAPHSKAYRLWDPASSRVFNSYHVSFFEHLESAPSSLLPGTTLGTNHASSPPSWDVVGPQPPPESPFPPSFPFSSFSDEPSSIPSTADQTHDRTIPPFDSSPNSPSSHSQNNNNVTPSLRNSSLDNNENTVEQQRTQQHEQQHHRQEDHPPPSPLTIRIPPRSLRRSNRLQGLEPDQDHTTAFLTEYSSVRDTHELIPTDLSIEGFPSVDDVLSALTDGTLSPTVDSDDDPLWAQAIASNEREYWIAGGRDELKSLQDLKVFVLVPRSDLPRGHRPLKGKLVCKRKRDDMGKVVRYKVRYVAKGFAQKYGVDYDKTTAPTVRLESFRSILHIAASLDWDLRQFDIKTAFLHGILPETETMFMEQPEGFEVPGKEDWVMKLMKSIYGMKQASRIWNQTFHKAVSQWGFERIPCEWCVYRRTSPTGTVIFAVHVDDIIATGSSPEEINHFRDFLKSQWEITELGEPKFALGIAISRDRSARTISLSQTAKIDQLVDEFGLTDARHVDTPMVPGLQLRRPDKTAPIPSEVADWIERTPYRSLVGSLMYFSVATRPDISYAVGRLSSFLDCFRLEHWEAAIRVLRYLKGTRLLNLVLGGKNPLSLSGYSDSDYANCVDTSRSIGGYCFTLGSGMISWGSRKQATVADSSCYAEYIALHDASHEVAFLRQLLNGLNFLPAGPTRLLCDNDAASRLAEDHVWHSHTKHIRVKYHYTRELVLAGETSVLRVNSKDNTADILTKPLARSDFQRLRHYLGVRMPVD